MSPMQSCRRACGTPCRGDLRDADPVLLSRTDAHRGAVLHVENRIARDPALHQPAEEQVVELLLGGRPLTAVFPALVRRLRGEEIRRVRCFRNEGSLRDDAAVDEALEIHEGAPTNDSRRVHARMRIMRRFFHFERISMTPVANSGAATTSA